MNWKGLQSSLLGAGVGLRSPEQLARLQTEAEQADLQRAFTSGESAQEREFRKRLQESSQGFQAGEGEKERNFRAGEASTDRTWRSGESAAERGWRTGERVGSEDFTLGRDKIQSSVQMARDALSRLHDMNMFQAEQDSPLTRERVGAMQSQRDINSAEAAQEQRKVPIGVMRSALIASGMPEAQVDATLRSLGASGGATELPFTYREMKTVFGPASALQPRQSPTFINAGDLFGQRPSAVQPRGGARPVIPAD